MESVKVKYSFGETRGTDITSWEGVVKNKSHEAILEELEKIHPGKVILIFKIDWINSIDQKY